MHMRLIHPPNKVSGGVPFTDLGRSSISIIIVSNTQNPRNTPDPYLPPVYPC